MTAKETVQENDLYAYDSFSGEAVKDRTTIFCGGAPVRTSNY
ncbi:hypothetical protein [Paraflavitalea speifideaquila]|nr:hypothetical protein [Paraflavitalea speifideiaquila]